MSKQIWIQSSQAIPKTIVVFRIPFQVHMVRFKWHGQMWPQDGGQIVVVDPDAIQVVATNKHTAREKEREREREKERERER